LREYLVNGVDATDNAWVGVWHALDDEAVRVVTFVSVDSKN